MNDEWSKFSNALIRQGNSLCVRVPSGIIKDLCLAEGDILAVKLQKLRMELSAKSLEAYFPLARKHKELDKFSRDKILVLSTIAFNEGKEVLDSNKGRVMATEKEGLAMLEVQKKYLARMKDEFGDRMYKDYLIFRKAIGKEFTKE